MPKHTLEPYESSKSTWRFDVSKQNGEQRDQALIRAWDFATDAAIAGPCDTNTDMDKHGRISIDFYPAADRLFHAVRLEQAARAYIIECGDRPDPERFMR